MVQYQQRNATNNVTKLHQVQKWTGLTSPCLRMNVLPFTVAKLSIARQLIVASCREVVSPLVSRTTTYMSLSIYLFVNLSYNTHIIKPLTLFCKPYPDNTVLPPHDVTSYVYFAVYLIVLC